MKRWLPIALVAAACVIPSVGCSSGTSAVEIKVLLDNQPVEGATVTLVSEDSASGTTAVGLTDANGICKPTITGGKGLPKGKYKATIVKTAATATGGTEVDPNNPPDPTKMMKEAMERARKNQGRMGQNELPPRYASVESSGLGLEVPTSGQVTFNLTK